MALPSGKLVRSLRFGTMRREPGVIVRRSVSLKASLPIFQPVCRAACIAVMPSAERRLVACARSGTAVIMWCVGALVMR